MLPKKLRLTRETFPDTRGLKRASSAHFSVSYGDSAKGGVAVVISKKVAKLAVSRHLLKRRILSVARPFVNGKHVIVIHTRPGAAGIPFTELKNELISLLGSILGRNL
jgi:ribonuclease P protein component